MRLNRDEISALGTDAIEIQANQFAAELLMPRAWFEAALASKSFDIDNESRSTSLRRNFASAGKPSNIALGI